MRINKANRSPKNQNHKPKIKKRRSKQRSKKKNPALCVNKAKIEFTDKSISAWGGIATLVAKFFEVINLQQWAEKLPLPEKSNNARGVYPKILAMILTVLCGGERFAHLSWWGHGIEIIERAFGVKWLPRASSTLTRMWQRVSTQQESEAFLEVCRDLMWSILVKTGIVDAILFFDSTVMIRYGNQEGAVRGYCPKKKGRNCHHPLLAFLDQGYVVNLWNRRGDSYTSNGIVDFFRQTLVRLGDSFKVRHVMADSGFYIREFLDELDAKGLRYTVAVPIQTWFQSYIQNRFGASHHWTEIDPGLEVTDFRYCHQVPGWKERRYVLVRQDTRKRPQATGKQPSLFEDLEEWKDYRFSLIVTNDETSPAVDVWRQYRQRATCENHIKDLKEGYSIDSFNVKNFWATEAVMAFITLVVHNLIHYLNCNVLTPKNSPLPQLKTLRAQWFNFGAILGRDGHQEIIRVGIQDRSLRCALTYRLEKIQQTCGNLIQQCISTPLEDITEAISEISPPLAT